MFLNSHRRMPMSPLTRTLAPAKRGRGMSRSALPTQDPEEPKQLRELTLHVSALGGRLGGGLGQVVRKVVEEVAGQAFPTTERLVLRNEAGEVFGVTGAAIEFDLYAHTAQPISSRSNRISRPPMCSRSTPRPPFAERQLEPIGYPPDHRAQHGTASRGPHAPVGDPLPGAGAARARLSEPPHSSPHTGGSSACLRAWSPPWPVTPVRPRRNLDGRRPMARRRSSLGRKSDIPLPAKHPADDAPAANESSTSMTPDPLSLSKPDAGQGNDLPGNLCPSLDADPARRAGNRQDEPGLPEARSPSTC